jgi:hypothetical protein
MRSDKKTVIETDKIVFDLIKSGKTYREVCAALGWKGNPGCQHVYVSNLRHKSRLYDMMSHNNEAENV